MHIIIKTYIFNSLCHYNSNSHINHTICYLNTKDPEYITHSESKTNNHTINIYNKPIDS